MKLIIKKAYKYIREDRSCCFFVVLLERGKHTQILKIIFHIILVKQKTHFTEQATSFGRDNIFIKKDKINYIHSQIDKLISKKET
jgi:hypothetical protein